MRVLAARCHPDEPKIKTYLSALAPTAAEAAQEEAKLKAAAEEMMK